MTQREAGERGPRQRVRMRGALARQVGLEEEALRAGRPAFGLGDQPVVRLARREHVPKPAERPCRRQHHAHCVPGVRRRMAEDVRPTLRVGDRLGQGGEDDPRGPQDDRDGPGSDHPHAQRSGRLIACACRDGDSGRRLGRARRRLERRGEPGRRELEGGEHLVAPAAAGDVEEQRPRRVCDVGRALAGEREPDVVLRQEDVRDSLVRLGLVAAKPKELGRREAGESAVARELEQAAEADPLLDLAALGAGALVVPEDGRPEHALVGVEGDEPVHLAGEADSGDVVDGERSEGLLGRAPPVFRVLLGPAGAGHRQWILALGPRHHLAGGAEGERLEAGGADVEADEGGHRSARPAARSASLASASSSSPGRPLTPTAPTRRPSSKAATPPRKKEKNGSKLASSAGSSRALSASSPVERASLRAAV